MAKLFTITEGVENLGALKSGGQGSVYKGRRTGEIVTAIKLLPTPVVDEQDKAYQDFLNEVEQLRKVNEHPHPNVVQVISWGITETGGFPYIEMEYIDGPDLGELLRPPHEPVFTIKEAIRVAEQLSSALAHVHAHGVKHGDIKSNNIKYNQRTGNYVLLDFGLALLSDEQRRTSLRQAGAIEFMAPEQSEGKMFFQTDVYSFGIVLFELLGGRVPFPLNGHTETERNRVMLSHLDAPVPDVAEWRRSVLPAAWDEEKRNLEADLPTWLIDLLHRCLQKDPERRFANGTELHEFIQLNQALGLKKAEIAERDSEAITDDVLHLRQERDALQQRLMHYQRETEAKDRELMELNARMRRHEDARITRTHRPRVVRKSRALPLLLLALVVGGLVAYGLLSRRERPVAANGSQDSALRPDTGRRESESNNTARARQGLPGRVRQQPPSVPQPKPPVRRDTVAITRPQPASNRTSTTVSPNAPEAGDQSAAQRREAGAAPVRYKVRSKAYFYNEPDEATRRNAFIVHWNNAVLVPQDDKNDFVYIVYTNNLGQTSRGWMRKADLVAVR